MNAPQRWTHFLQCSSKLLKAAAKSTAFRDLATPSQAFLKLSWSRIWPASPSLTFLNKKNSAGTRLGEYSGCFLYFCKAFASSGEIGGEVSHSLHTRPEVGETSYDWLGSSLPEHIGISGKNRFTETCSSYMQLHCLYRQQTSKVKLSWVKRRFTFVCIHTMYMYWTTYWYTLQAWDDKPSSTLRLTPLFYLLFPLIDPLPPP